MRMAKLNETQLQNDMWRLSQNSFDFANNNDNNNNNNNICNI